MPQEIILSETAVYVLGNAVPDNYEVGLLSFQVQGSTSPAWSGSAVVEARQFDSTLEWEEVPYYNVGTKSIIAAGTAITDDGLYEVISNGRAIRLNYTHTDGSATVVYTPMGGPASLLASGGGGGGGGDVNLTEVGGASISLGAKTAANSLPVVLATDEIVPVQGAVAHDAAASGNPVLNGAYASAAAPSDVSADGDAVHLWALRNGSQVVNVAAGGALITGDGTNGLDVDVTRLPALPSGSNTIGGVNLTQYTPASGRLPVDGSGVTQPIKGQIAAGAAISGTNPTLIGISDGSANLQALTGTTAGAYVLQKAASATVGQQSLNGTAAQIVASNAARVGLTIKNMDATNPCYIGTSSGVTTSNGFKIDPGQQETLSITSNAWYGITASPTVVVCYISV